MPNQSSLFAHSPHWRKNHAGLLSTLPEDVQSWLFETNSLTQRLRTHFGSRLRVKILRQQWQKPFISESQLLKLPSAHYCLTREVLLEADAVPLILARSIIPKATIAIAQRNLSHLGTRPLGEVIFSYPNLQRLVLELTCIPATSWQKDYLTTYDLHDLTWGRRTIYAIPAEPLLVSEFFMPGIYALGKN